MEVFEQLSLFAPMNCSEKSNSSLTAVCCMGGNRAQTIQLESWMKALVPNGEYAIDIGAPLLMVLRPVKGTTKSIPQGHEYYHYMIGQKLYAGIFVGRETA